MRFAWCTGGLVPPGRVAWWTRLFPECAWKRSHCTLYHRWGQQALRFDSSCLMSEPAFETRVDGHPRDGQPHLVEWLVWDRRPEVVGLTDGGRAAEKLSWRLFYLAFVKHSSIAHFTA